MINARSAQKNVNFVVLSEVESYVVMIRLRSEDSEIAECRESVDSSVMPVFGGYI